MYIYDMSLYNTIAEQHAEWLDSLTPYTALNI